MFFFLPINTDAPVYHFPWATLAIIATNVLVFTGMVTGDVPTEEWILAYGDGLHPLQWLTSNFMHDGLGHLLGNMYLLWGLGLIVEGKIGWGRFLLVYLGMGICESALEQTLMLGAPQGGSLGASSIVFGLTVIALIWAPKNEIGIMWFVIVGIIYRGGIFEISIFAYAMLVLALEGIVFLISGMHIGAAALHLMGALVGLGVGVSMIKLNLVNCEGWDLFSVMRGDNVRLIGDILSPNAQRSTVKTAKRKRKRKKKKRSSRILQESAAELSVPREEKVNTPEQARRLILRRIGDGKPIAALRELQNQQHLDPEFRLESGPLRKLSQSLIEQQEWDDAIVLLEEHLERFDQHADPIRIQLAALLSQKQSRPRAAYKLLKQVDREKLSEKQQSQMDTIGRQSLQMVKSGVIELSGQSFSSRR